MSDGSGGRNASLTVLCALATRRWQVHPVSEHGWQPTVITHIQSLEPGLSMIAMVEGSEVRDQSRLRIRKIARRCQALLGSATLPVRLAGLAAIQAGLLDDVDQVHVGLPRAVGPDGGVPRRHLDTSGACRRHHGAAVIGGLPTRHGRCPRGIVFPGRLRATVALSMPCDRPEFQILSSPRADPKEGC